jgi:hypothetical protein
MRIDVHAHYWTDDYLDLLVDLGKTDTGAQRGLGAGGGEELEARLRLMDRAGVDLQAEDEANAVLEGNAAAVVGISTPANGPAA